MVLEKNGRRGERCFLASQNGSSQEFSILLTYFPDKFYKALKSFPLWQNLSYHTFYCSVFLLKSFPGWVFNSEEQGISVPSFHIYSVLIVLHVKMYNDFSDPMIKFEDEISKES